jgi:hypothetical protein
MDDANTAVIDRAAPQAQPTLKLGEINGRLAPLSISEAGLRELGFPAAARERNACLYFETDFPAICDAIVDHVTDAREARKVA